MTAHTRTRRRRFVPSINALEGRQLLSTTNLLADSSFETYQLGNPGTPYSYEYAPVTPNWNFQWASGLSGNGTDFTEGNPNAPDGSQVAFLYSSDGAISQTFNSQSSGLGTISFKAAQEHDLCGYTFDSHQSITVKLNGTIIGSATPLSTSYQDFTIQNVNLLSGANTLELDGTTDGQNVAFVDQVSIINQEPVMSNTLNTSSFSMTEGTVARTFQVTVTGSYNIQFDASHSVAYPNWGGPGLGVSFSSAEGNIWTGAFSPFFDTLTHTYTTHPVDLEAGRDYTVVFSGGYSAGSGTVAFSNIQMNALSPLGSTSGTFTDSGFPSSYTYNGTWTVHPFTVPTTGVYVVTFNAASVYPDYIYKNPAIGVDVRSLGQAVSPGTLGNLGIISPRSSSPMQYVSQSIRLVAGTTYNLTLGNSSDNRSQATIDTVRILQVGDSSADFSPSQS